jgi:hypothetical protein
MPRFNEKWLGLKVLVVPGSEAVSRTHLSRFIGNDRIGASRAVPAAKAERRLWVRSDPLLPTLAFATHFWVTGS